MYKGIEQATKEFNTWEGAASIFIDVEDHDAWCVVKDEASYNSDSVIHLISKNDVDDRFEAYPAEVLSQLAEAKEKALADGYEAWQVNQIYLFAEIIY
ncbi:hypothetical protein [Aureibacillus halotolerans]|uniref:Uncharacterized protein n=1 Tax=Aureibacillus halotolerans TaxID=1508390 RepID=A0A4R6U1R6_9BACI|nr:hypothetical protein [Aureibacillus halotolerans]TDQ39252.1 hypothetical protein EV213_108204 [Aureibacillus halotolerans]